MVKYHFFMNSFFALSLDTYNKKEYIIRCVGYADEYLNKRINKACTESRELGELIFDFSSTMELFSTENRYNALFDYLTEYYNLIEDNKSGWYYDDDLYEEHEAYCEYMNYLKCPILSENFFDAQKHLSLNQRHQYSSYDLLKQCYPDILSGVSNGIRVIYIGDSPYIATDFRVIDLLGFYLDKLYEKGLFPRSCMSCGSLFLSGKKNGDVLCSADCRKKKKSQNTMAYYGRLSENEVLYNNIYRKWKQRIGRAEEKHTISEDGIEKLNQGLNYLTHINRTRANERKMGNVKEINGIPDYVSFDSDYKHFLTSQDEYLYQLFNSLIQDK